MERGTLRRSKREDGRCQRRVAPVTLAILTSRCAFSEEWCKDARNSTTGGWCRMSTRVAVACSRACRSSHSLRTSSGGATSPARLRPRRGEDGEVVEITDTFVGVHPEGALLKVSVDAPSLEDAEAAVGALVEEIREGCKPLASWPVDKCQVELHLDLAKESREAVDGPDGPASDLAVRAATHRSPRCTSCAGAPPAQAPRLVAQRASLRHLRRRPDHRRLTDRFGLTFEGAGGR